jgi:23S rRNA pseudouridine1911/1915/1917 synthase
LDGQRLDRALAQLKPEYSRSYWKQMIQGEYVTENGQAVDVKKTVHTADQVAITWPTVTKAHAFRHISIIFEDDNVLVVDKPAGILSHSKGAFNPEYTVADLAHEHYSFGSEETVKTGREGIIHRLDRNTSGVMILAKNDTTQHTLMKEFARRKVTKTYLAVSVGNRAVMENGITIDVPIARSKRNPRTFEASPTGKSAQSRVLEDLSLDDSNYRVLAIQPQTGRTHQIRVHLSYLHLPIVGDTEYGSKITLDSHRFLLHAYALEIRLPYESGRRLFTTKIPSDMTPYINEASAENLRRRFDAEVHT